MSVRYWLPPKRVVRAVGKRDEVSLGGSSPSRPGQAWKKRSQLFRARSGSKALRTSLANQGSQQAVCSTSGSTAAIECSVAIPLAASRRKGGLSHVAMFVSRGSGKPGSVSANFSARCVAMVWHPIGGQWFHPAPPSSFCASPSTQLVQELLR